MKEVFDQFDSDCDRILRGVKMFASQDLPEVVSFVELDFGTFVVFVCIDAEWDTLICARDLPQRYTMERLVSLSSAFWTSVLGHTLSNAWLMTSDSRGTDAMQLRFRDPPNSDSMTLIQIEAVASGLDMVELTVHRERKWASPVD